MKQEHYVRPSGLPPVNGYSHAVAHQGRSILVSGQVPLDADGNLVGAGDPERQVAQVFTNLATALAAAGAGLHDVVKLTVYLTDRADLAAFRRVRDRHIDLARPPASTLVLVHGLIDPEFRVEIDALAVR
ncbi:RidA family protein [Dactylosporangium sp. NPDC050588]|uniref:RidA family protein n=1 Tax=Dactylosporangium sp. NPDC050588 TaxID=3157211 RepID=UPI0034116E3D